MLGRPVLGRLGAATAPALLVVVALVVALSRVSDAEVNGVRPNVAPRAAPTQPSSGSAGDATAPVALPSAPSEGSSAPAPAVPSPPPGGGPLSPGSPSWVAPPVVVDASPVHPRFYDFR